MSCIVVTKPSDKGVRLISVAMYRRELALLLAKYAEEKGERELAEAIRKQCLWVDIEKTRQGVSFDLVCDPANEKKEGGGSGSV